MASSTINGIQISNGSATLADGRTGTFQLSYVRKVDNLCFFRMRVYGATDEVANGAVFQLAEGSRPSTTTNVIGSAVINGSLLPVPFSVIADGRININYSSSATFTQATVYGVFSLI